MTRSFFGELYLRSTRPFLGDAVSEQEADYLAKAFSRIDLEGPVLDLGCGHGRHASRLQGRLPHGHAVIGVELDGLSLAEREGGFPAVQGDFTALPFAPASLGGAFAWYSTLFCFEEATQHRILEEVSRCLKPGGYLIFQTLPRERIEREPASSYDGALPDGSHLQEENRFNPTNGRDEGTRRLTLPDGRVLSAQYFIRYYRVSELEQLLAEHRFTVRWVHGGLSGEPLSSDSADLIMGVQRDD